MKKTITFLSIVIITCCAATNSFAQTFGIKVGANLANQIVKDNSTTYSNDNKILLGMHLGPIVEFSLNDMFSIETGILGSIKGSKNYSESTFLSKKFENTSKLYLLYVDIPLTAKVGFKAGNTKVYVNAGPYVGIGTMGKNIYVSKIDGNTESSGDRNVEWGKEITDNFKRLDFGLTAGAGIEVGAIQISASYELGFANIASHSNNGYTVNNRVIGISLAFRFGGDR